MHSSVHSSLPGTLGELLQPPGGFRGKLAAWARHMVLAEHGGTQLGNKFPKLQSPKALEPSTGGTGGRWSCWLGGGSPMEARRKWLCCILLLLGSVGV